MKSMVALLLKGRKESFHLLPCNSRATVGCVKATKRHKKDWPRKVTVGGRIVKVYRRKTPQGNFAYMVANYATGKRRFDSYATEGEATEAALRLARQLSIQDTKAAAMTEAQAVEYVRASEVLQPYGLTVGASAEILAETLKKIGDTTTLLEAVKFYTARNKKITDKRVVDVVAELIARKVSQGASVRYQQDLRSRLNKFGKKFQCNIGSVSTAMIQEWLDSLNLKSAQTYMNFRRVVHLLFEYSVTRGYAVDNPISAVENRKIRNGDVSIFTPSEISRLLAVASPNFQPCIAIGAFAGLRSAEIQRLEWSNIDLFGRFITIGVKASKTATRRIVPMHDNLFAWLRNHAERKGKVWEGTHKEFYDAQQETAHATKVDSNVKANIPAITAVRWKQNGLRHSYASYRFAQTGDAGRVAGELGNSAGVVHRHYRELVKPAEAIKWFGVIPDTAANVLPLITAI
jgi:integrase